MAEAARAFIEALNAPAGKVCGIWAGSTPPQVCRRFRCFLCSPSSPAGAGSSPPEPRFVDMAPLGGEE